MSDPRDERHVIAIASDIIQDIAYDKSGSLHRSTLDALAEHYDDLGRALELIGVTPPKKEAG